MSKTLAKVAIALSLQLALLIPSAAQQLKVQLGPEKTAAVSAMLNSLFPDATPVWSTSLWIQRRADGTRTRLALTPVIKMTAGNVTEFIAGIQEWDASSTDFSQLRAGALVSGEHSRANLIAVAMDGSGAFTVVASLTLEPGHTLAVITQLGTDPTNPAGIVITYKTADLYQNNVVEVVWMAELGSDLSVVRKYPQGIEIKTPGQKSVDTILFITPTATGITIHNPQTDTRTVLPCSQICEPTLSQLLGGS